MKSNKEIAGEIYLKHISLATTNGRLFRKTVMDEIQALFECSLAASATFYNNAKKSAEPVAGLGRPEVSKNIRKPGQRLNTEELQDDNDCFSVVELLRHHDDVTVGRCRAYLMQGDASEAFDDRVKYRPSTTWILMQGLGPLSGESFKLRDGEKEVKRYTPSIEKLVEKEVCELTEV